MWSPGFMPNMGIRSLDREVLKFKYGKYDGGIT